MICIGFAFIHGKALKGINTFFLAGASVKCDGSVSQAIKLSRKLLRLVYSTAKNKTLDSVTAISEILCLFYYVLNSRIAGESSEILRGKPPAGNFLFVHRRYLRYPEIVKRAQKVVLHSLFKSYFKSQLVVEYFIDILSLLIVIHLVRSCRHAQKQLRPEIVHNLLVGSRTAVMGFIKNYAVEGVLFVLEQMSVTVQCLHRREDIIAIVFTAPCAHQPHGNAVVKDHTIRLPALPGELPSVHKEQHPLETAFPHCKGRRIGFACACG